MSAESDVAAIQQTAAAHHNEKEVFAQEKAASDRSSNNGQPPTTFDPAAERRLRRKIDWMIVPTVAMIYLWTFIDRANIGNAQIAGFSTDLGLKGYQYNVVLTVFYISYIVFEIPSNILCKKIGPGWFLPFLTLCFGIISFGTAFVHDFSSVCGVRFLLGIFEAGMLPGIALYLSRWYTRSELTFRLALYIVMAPIAGAFGGLLASGILKLDSVGSVRSWRMIFLIEGIITCGVSLISFFTMTDRPETATWLTPEEKKLAADRVRVQRIGGEVVDKMTVKRLKQGMLNPVTLGVSTIFLFDNITVQGLAFFLPTIVRTIYPKETVIYQQLWTVPPYVVGAFFTMVIPYLSWKLDRRQIFFIISAPLIMIGYIMFLATARTNVRYGATFLITSGAFSFGSLSNAQVSANVNTDTARVTAIGTNVMFGNIGGLISTWAFLPFDGPSYPIGNGLNLATSSSIFILSTALYFWMIRDNRKRDAKESSTVETGLQGVTTQTEQDMDWRHPSFRWHP